ncbi:MAG: hypothetical protein NC300_11270 [Bacteroidales bacterium]|nr:hypothetical protein [Clostridium sp.]MCM1204711.1 hypothetical protein [Bacteroidales bacterium]
MLRLKNVEVNRSNVYVICNGSTLHYSHNLVKAFGDYEIVEISIVNSNLYLVVKAE